jgi:uncharacterized Zn-binding protein involved in type VI secretion
MALPWIVIGDRTSHGGTVIEGDPTFTTHGKPVAHVGHMTTCPRCKGGPFPIVTGAPDFINYGKPVARHGDKTACGATLIAAQVVSTWSAESGPLSRGAGSTTFIASHAASDAQQQFDDHFIIHDAATGEQLANIEYAIRRATGEIEHGMTDREGRTHLLSAVAQQENVTVYIEG